MISWTAIALCFIGNLVFSWAVNKLLLRFAMSLGIRKKKEFTIRWSNQVKPSVGGISFYLSFLLTLMIFILLDTSNALDFRSPISLGLFFSLSLATLIGFLDDTFNTFPWLKLLGQISCGLIIAFTGNIIPLTSFYAINVAVTVFWVVSLMNALNLLDNMDGVTGSISLATLVGLFAFLFIQEDSSNILMLSVVAVAGSLIGFLKLNWHPALIYMGDTGSQFLGLFVAFIGIHAVWPNESPLFEINWNGILLSLCALTPAFVDTTTVIINRLKKGKSPVIGGRDHTTHHLFYSGRSEKQVALIFGILSFIGIALALVIHFLIRTIHPFWIILAPIYTLTVFFLLYRNTIQFSDPNKDSSTN